MPPPPCDNFWCAFPVYICSLVFIRHHNFCAWYTLTTLTASTQFFNIFLLTTFERPDIHNFFYILTASYRHTSTDNREHEEQLIHLHKGYMYLKHTQLATNLKCWNCYKIIRSCVTWNLGLCKMRSMTIK